jgi:hypothetical protein
MFSTIFIKKTKGIHWGWGRGGGGRNVRVFWRGCRGFVVVAGGCRGCCFVVVRGGRECDLVGTGLVVGTGRVVVVVGTGLVVVVVGTGLVVVVVGTGRTRGVGNRWDPTTEKKKLFIVRIRK